MRFLDTSKIRTRFNERVPMADGTELSIDLYLPPQRGQFPVLMTRTASDNNRVGRVEISVAPAERWKTFAAQGFIVATGDVRGRGDSGGQFTPFIHEGIDGAESVAWLRALDECNGMIGLFGSGYGAFCAWAAAVADGHVDALASISPFGAVGEGLVHWGGAIRLDWLFWMHLSGGRTVQPPNAPPWKTIYRHWPLQTMDEALGRSDIWWKEWLDHIDRDDSYWKPLDLADKIAALKVPGLHITGWWDGQAAGAQYYYQAGCRSGAPQQLIVGPWDTAAVRRPAQVVGGCAFGPRSLIDLDETLVGFFNAHLRKDPKLITHGGDQGKATPREADARAAQARLFVTGRNEWVTTPAWPSKSPDSLILYLRSRRGANTRRGDGVLSATAPTAKSTDCVSHNPRVPVEFQPQFSSFASGANPFGFTLDQGHITARDEALVFTSAPLERSLTIIGNPCVTLSIITEAADLDLFVLLSDCFPLEARDFHLGHSAIRCGQIAPLPDTAIRTVRMTLNPLAHDFLTGHQIRLTITPSLFPLYACNPQSAGYFRAVEPQMAVIQLLHGPQAPSHLSIPIAMRGLSLE